MNPKEAEHRQLEGESLVEAARERAVAWEACECESDEQILRKALEALRKWGSHAPRHGSGCRLCDATRSIITELEERLLRE